MVSPNGAGSFMAAPRRSAVVLVLLASTSCNGFAYISDEAGCVGAHCDVVCAVDVDCPGPSVCRLGRCTEPPSASPLDVPIEGQEGDPAGGDPYPAEPGDDGALSGEDDNPFADDALPADPDVDGDPVVTCQVGAPEVCNYVDDNCDGAIDEGVRDRCGGCDPRACADTTIGSGGDVPFDPPDPQDGVLLNTDGTLTLETSTVTTDFAYPSNDPEGTVSRVDTITLREVGRYPSVLRLTASGAPCTGVGDCSPDVSDWWTGCNRPSRTTVDRDGSAYVANRNLEVGNIGRFCNPHSGGNSEQGSVTKIALYERRFCEGSDLTRCKCDDRNGNGRIDTSHDLDGDGVIEGDAVQGSCTGSACATPCTSDAECGGAHCVIGWCSSTPSKGEYLGYADECVQWTARLPGDRPAARAMAIDAAGFVWAGDFRNQKVFKIDPLGTVVDPDGVGPATAASGISVGVSPYGAVTDGLGRMWVLHSSNTGQLQYVDTATGALGYGSPEADNPSRGYGVTVDRRNRVWMASSVDTLDDALTAASTRNGGSLARYDATADTWVAFGAGLNAAAGLDLDAEWVGRGVSATGAGTARDGQGIVWAAFHRSDAAWLVGVEDDTGEIVHRVNLNAACGALTSIGVGIGALGRVWTVNRGTDSMCAYDPATGEVETVRIGRRPYTYSDFTGNIFRTFTQPVGVHRVAQLACESPYYLRGWESLSWDAVAPGTSKVEVLVRVGATLAAAVNALPSLTATTEPTHSLDLRGVPELPYLVVELRLHAGAPGQAPVVRSLNLLRRCALDE